MYCLISVLGVNLITVMSWAFTTIHTFVAVYLVIQELLLDGNNLEELVLCSVKCCLFDCSQFFLYVTLNKSYFPWRGQLNNRPVWEIEVAMMSNAFNTVQSLPFVKSCFPWRGEIWNGPVQCEKILVSLWCSVSSMLLICLCSNHYWSHVIFKSYFPLSVLHSENMCVKSVIMVLFRRMFLS